MPIDEDLQGIWVYIPQSEWDKRPEYGTQPFRFRAIRQNGSRLHLRKVNADGSDARYPAEDEFVDTGVAGQFIERRAYSSDVRGHDGKYWQREDSGQATAGREDAEREQHEYEQQVWEQEQRRLASPSAYSTRTGCSAAMRAVRPTWPIVTLCT